MHVPSLKKMPVPKRLWEHLYLAKKPPLKCFTALEWFVSLLRMKKIFLKLVPEQHLYLNYPHVASLCVRI